jgi:hypothetical protein
MEESARIVRFTDQHRRRIALSKMGKSLSSSHREAIAAANSGRARRIPDGERIRDISAVLRARGLTISAIAARLRVSRSTIYNILNGRHWSSRR